MNTTPNFSNDFYKKVRGNFGNNHSMNILYCFSKPSTDAALCNLSTAILQSKSAKGQITALNILNEKQASAINNIELYKQDIFSEIVGYCTKENILHRSLLEISDNFVETILNTAKTHDASLILLGMGHSVFSDTMWNKMVENMQLQHHDEKENSPKTYNPENSESFSQGVSSLIERNPHATGIFLLRDFETMHRIFILILDREDVYTLIYLNALFENQQYTFTLWDAIGIFEQDAELNRILKSAQKKYGNRLKFWDVNKKIELDFIQSLDLAVTGIKGWWKLINSAIPWKSHLPSTLIFKQEKRHTNEL